MVGNDVVDLACAPAPRARFVARVLCERERSMLDASPDPAALLWSLFAAKEAAYKAIARIRGPIVFAHRAFVVAPDLRSIRHEDTTLTLQIDRTDDWVHALAHDPIAHPTWSVAPRGAEDPSGAARALLCAHAAAQLGIDASSLTVVRDALPGSWTGLGPPRLVISQEGGRTESESRVAGPRAARAHDPKQTFPSFRLPVHSRERHALSLSHDGRFVACAADLDLPSFSTSRRVGDLAQSTTPTLHSTSREGYSRL